MSILELLQEEVDNKEANAGEEKKQQELEKDKEVINVLKTDNDAKNLINEEYLEEAKKKKAKPSPIFDAENSKITDEKEHFPINTEAKAKKVLEKIEACTEAPKWWKGTVNQLQSAVKKAVKKAFPDLDKDKE